MAVADGDGVYDVLVGIVDVQLVSVEESDAQLDDLLGAGAGVLGADGRQDPGRVVVGPLPPAGPLSGPLAEAADDGLELGGGASALDGGGPFAGGFPDFGVVNGQVLELGYELCDSDLGRLSQVCRKEVAGDEFGAVEEGDSHQVGAGVDGDEPGGHQRFTGQSLSAAWQMIKLSRARVMAT